MVQDDERERELVRLFNLAWDPAHQRAGVDALLRVTLAGVEHTLEVEVKSTTGDTVSTARDVGMDHIRKWRRKLFVIGFYSKHARRPELLRCLCLTPADMAGWIDGVESKIAVDHLIAERAAAGLEAGDLVAVCGAKPFYSVEDARLVLRQQWSADRYQQAADTTDPTGAPAYSPELMLGVLRARARYIAERGATLNNPHITKAHLAAFAGTSREITDDWAAGIRAVAGVWLSEAAG
jgi:hypothetical protein